MAKKKTRKQAPKAEEKAEEQPAQDTQPKRAPLEVEAPERPAQPKPFGSTAKPPKVTLPADGTLLRMDGAPAVFVMRDGQRRPFANAAVFTACRFGWNEIVVLPPKEIIPIPVGPEVVRASDL